MVLRWTTACMAAMVSTALSGCGENCDKLLSAVVIGDEKTVSALLERGCPVDVKDSKLQLMPLHLAALHGRRRIAGLLIDHGADVNAKGGLRGDDTPLLLAVSGRLGDDSPVAQAKREVAKLLLGKGADPNTPTSEGRTPLNLALAVRDAPLVSILVRNGASPNIRTESGTVLHDLLKEGQEELVAALLTPNTDLEAVDKRGRTLLHLAASLGKTKIASMLIQGGAKVTVLDNEGDTPLRLARWGKPDIAEMLRKAGAREMYCWSSKDIDLGEMPVGQRAQATIEVWADSDDLKVTDVRYPRETFDVTSRKMSTDELAKRSALAGMRITVSIRPDVPAGPLECRITIVGAFRAFPKRSAFKKDVDIKARVSGTVECQPASLVFGFVTGPEKSIKRAFIYQRVKREKDLELSLRPIQSTVLKANLQRVKQRNYSFSWILEVAVPATVPTGAFEERILIETNDPRTPLLAVPVTGLKLVWKQSK
jgi:ankyrin repeat protein